MVNFGKSMIVPSVQELAKQPIAQIPSRYLQSHQESPISPEGSSLPSVPVIDFQKLVTGGSMDCELEKLHSACKEWGFFLIINHGVSSSLLEKFKIDIENFFKLPYEEKKKLWQEPDNFEGFGQLFVISEEQKLDWSDMFYITTLPFSLRKTQLFEKLPRKLRETLESYAAEMKKVAMAILCHMAKALKMDEEEMKGLFADGVQAMRMAYYPPCPQPDKVIGLAPHSDSDALTIILQLNDTEGLQIRKDGRWVLVKPPRDAFVVNIGDIMEIVSNGIYRSIEHRAIVNSTKERLSVSTFYSPKLDSELGPAHSLIGPNSPAVFRRVPFEMHIKEFVAQKLNGKTNLDFMRMDSENSAT